MQPLFEQVYHGCAAGLYDEMYNDVYWEKINRRSEYFITKKLGAGETNLSLVRIFFLESDLSQMLLVSEKGYQSWLLAIAGLALLSIGRPKEAEELYKRKLKMNDKENQWENVSGSHRNLVDLQFRTGELESALSSVKKALDAAGKAKSDRDIGHSKAYIAWILHLLGKDEEAGNWFRQADELQIKIDHDGVWLHGLRGVRYADFIMLMKRFDDAFELTKQNLEICQRNKWLNDISRCHRCLGAIARIKRNHDVAKTHLQNAFDIARKIGVPDLEIEALLESGRLQLDMKRHEDAIRDAKEVLKICARTGFKFYEFEAEVVLGKAYLALNDREQAKTFAHSAYEKAIGMNYRWQEGDAAHLLGEIYLAVGDKLRAREWLEKAVGCRKEIWDPEVKDPERMLKSL